MEKLNTFINPAFCPTHGCAEYNIDNDSFHYFLKIAVDDKSAILEIRIDRTQPLQPQLVGLFQVAATRLSEMIGSKLDPYSKN